MVTKDEIEENTSDKFRNTLLGHAIRNNSSAMMKTLLQTGADSSQVKQEIDQKNPIFFEPHPAIERARQDIEHRIELCDGNQLYEMSEQDAKFLQGLVTTGLLVNALEKMNYDQSKDIYDKTQQELSPALKNRIEDMIRNKR